MNREKNIRLILLQLTGEANHDEQEKFKEWLIEDAANFDFFMELKSIWELPMVQEQNFDKTKALARMNKAIHKKKGINKLLQYSRRIAAFAIVALFISILYLKKESFFERETSSTVQQIIKTSNPAEQLRLHLPDGSVVRLNSGSSIQYPEQFEQKYRQVKLIGEAFFEIARDTCRPFTILSGNLQTTVLGTSFNIRAFEQRDISVTVVTGAVKVESLAAKQVGELYLKQNPGYD